jgi:serine/threonine-protein kinase
MRSGVVIASKYRIVKELGSGGMGSVWQAVNLATEREFAIKFLHAALAKNQGLLARFFQEAKVSGKLRHPSIIEIFDVGAAAELDDTPFLVMELLDGASLDVLMRRTKAPVPTRIALESMADIARALALAHEKGIVHRDLKPANIFLHRPGTGAVVPKVLDFGISKFAGAAAPDINTGLTQTGAVLGSPLYMSPEQAASDKSIDGRSDVHALGVVLWECLVGEPPFTADTYNNLVVRIITGDRPLLADTLPGVSPGIAAIVDRAMARRREDRFQTAGEMADALEAEIARLLPSTSITARGAAAEVFARMGPASMKPPAETTAEAIGTTTGGMSVPSARAASDVSPAAFTVQDSLPRSSSETAFAATQVASAGPPGSRPVGPTLVSAGTPATTTAARSRTRTLVAAGAAGVALVSVALAFALRHPPAPAVTADPSAASPSPPPIPTTLVPSPSASSSAVAAASTTAPAPSASASSAHVVKPAAGPAPAAATGKRPGPTKKVDDSVQSSGF